MTDPTRWSPRSRRALPRGWVPAPVTRPLPEDATQHLNASRQHDEESLAMTPSYEDFVVPRRPLPVGVERALKMAMGR
jgi:hypothetical protein